ncbi:MAG: bifunctional precorrin-2 dehydrogenase/sirohydrochlorin ferrochelatase [Candidatus Hydrogenedentota bacterium]
MKNSICSLYPLILDLKDKNILIIGGGDVAFRKLKNLLYCKANITLISQKYIKKLKNLCNKYNIKTIQRKARFKDLRKDVFMVIDATDDIKLHKRLYEKCDREKILLNVVDSPQYCNFIVPAVVKRGDLLIAISTSGKTPFITKKVRQDIEKVFDKKWGKYIKICEIIRNELKSMDKPERVKKKVYNILSKNFICKIEDARKLLKKHEIKL